MKLWCIITTYVGIGGVVDVNIKLNLFWSIKKKGACIKQQELYRLLSSDGKLLGMNHFDTGRVCKYDYEIMMYA